MKKLIALLILASTPALASTEFKLPTPETETLPNGLKIVWFVSDRLPVINLEMAFRSGSRDDLKGKSGTAELVAATLDRGAGGMTAREIARRTESIGASRGASADDEFFRVDLHGLASDGGTLLDLLSKLVLQPEFPDKEIKQEQARMLDGWSRLPDYGESLVDLAYRRAMTRGTVYARGGLLSSREFAHLTRNDLISYWRKNFSPKNATLLIVGRVDRKAFRSKIGTLFNDWAEAGRARYAYHEEAPHRSAAKAAPALAPWKKQVLLVDRPSLTQAEVRIGFRAPALRDPRHYPLIIANALLGEYFHSRLNTLIRDKLGLTYGISSGFNYNRDLTTLSISAATRNEATGDLIQKSLGVLKNLKNGPIADEEVQTAKDYLIGGFPLSTATLEGVAGKWMVNDLYDLGPDRLNQYIPRIEAITSKDVAAAVSKSFDLDHIAVVVAGDAKAIEPVLKKAGFSVQRVSAQSLIDGKF